jgi:Spy/CpxP family protein refolding chaperone
MQDIVQRYRPQIREQRAVLRQTQRDISARLSGADYDRAAVEMHFQMLREQTMALQQLMQSMMLDIADKLSPEERARFLRRNPMAEKGLRP